MENPEEPLPDFSDVQGGSSSSASSTRTYTVAKGDTLSLIAKAVYGQPNKWKAIYEANQDVIKNPDLIYPGQVLKIPDA